ncbi:hypothetical protein [Alteromonas portus]|uniref:hypothetical protein n=1 Tax=Alteromonas portus TaxID=2565549 RepID=UPI003BF873B0
MHSECEKFSAHQLFEGFFSCPSSTEILLEFCLLLYISDLFFCEKDITGYSIQPYSDDWFRYPGGDSYDLEYCALKECLNGNKGPFSSRTQQYRQAATQREESIYRSGRNRYLLKLAE